jgi:hypothetical protein
MLRPFGDGIMGQLLTRSGPSWGQEAPDLDRFDPSGEGGDEPAGAGPRGCAVLGRSGREGVGVVPVVPMVPPEELDPSIRTCGWALTANAPEAQPRRDMDVVTLRGMDLVTPKTRAVRTSSKHQEG